MSNFKSTEEIIQLLSPIIKRKNDRFSNLNKQLAPMAPYIAFYELNRTNVIMNYSPYSNMLQEMESIGLINPNIDKLSTGGFTFEQIGSIMRYLWENISAEERKTYEDACIQLYR